MTRKPAVYWTVLAVLVSLRAGAQLPPLIDLNVTPGTETTPVFRIYGDDTGDRLGDVFACSDINGDGCDDVILGMGAAGGSTANPTALGAGEVYVVYGGADLPDAVLNLDTDGLISPAAETRILGDKGKTADDTVGNRVFGNGLAAGDVNGDGFGDAIVSAYLGSPTFPNESVTKRHWAGTVFIFYGSAGLPGSLLNLHTDGVASQFGETRILGKGPYDHIGASGVAGGDFSGDGYGDLCFGGRGVRNKAYIFYGSAALAGSVLDLNSPTGSHNETTIIGDGFSADPESFPESMCGGDVNGDGFDDLVLGAGNADPAGRTNAGAVYILYGSATLPRTTVDLRNPPLSNGTTHILGPTPGDRTGWSVASGDVDGDGFDDLLIGAPGACPGGRVSAGGAYVIYGSADLPGAIVDLGGADPFTGTRILGHDGAELGWGGDAAGRSASCADVDGDGFDDVIVGAYARHLTQTGAKVMGETYVIYGRTDLREVTVELNTPSGHPQDLRVLADSPGIPMDGSARDSADLDRDGFADFATRVSNSGFTVPGTVAGAGGLVAVLGRGTSPTATAAERIRSGDAPRRGLGGRLSPVLRTWLSFEGGDDGEGGASLATVTLTRTDAGISGLGDGSLLDVADLVWEVNADRQGATASWVTFQYLDAEIAGLAEEDLRLYEAQSLSGPWTPVAGQTLDNARNEIGGLMTGTYFAVCGTPPNACPTADAGADVEVYRSGQAATVIWGQAFDPDPNPALEYRWLDVSAGAPAVLLDWGPTGAAFEAPLDLGFLAPFAIGESILRLEVSDGACTACDEMALCILNSAPTADAGDNVMVSSEQQAWTTIHGVATDADGDALSYRWLEVDEGGGATVLSPFTAAGPLGAAPLPLGQLAPLSIGQHVLRLEASDGTESASDDMALTVDNSPPTLTLTGCGTYRLSDPVLVGGSASDYDGDWLDWSIEGEGGVLASGQVHPPFGGAPVEIDSVDLTGAFGVGSHTLTLTATDGINQASSGAGSVTIIDTEAPSLAPAPSVSQLWPPNHELTPVTIWANALDDSGAPIALYVSVVSDEPVDAQGAGTTEPDWVFDSIQDGPGGRIDLRLRAERSGKGDGRIYTVTITAQDASGNTSSAQIQIAAPHDRGRR